MPDHREMITKHSVQLWLGFFISTTLALGCSTPGVNQPPSSSLGQRNPTQVLDEPHVHGEQAIADLANDKILVDAYLSRGPDADATLMNEMRAQLSIVSTTQKLASSFDLMVSQLQQAGTTVDTEQLNRSQLYCELWENSEFLMGAEARLQAVQTQLLTRGRQSDYDWYLALFRANFGDSPAELMAKAQMIRVLNDNHANVCQHRTPCLRFTDFPGRPLGPFDPLNDQEMLDFKNAMLPRLALSNARDLYQRPGECYQQATRSPNSTGTFDWGQRNHTGRGQPKGTFIVTYDDGPHPKYTQAIASLWANARLAKPTFFWLAENAQKYPSIVEELHRNGFEVACHSHSHPDIGNIAKATSFANLSKLNRSHFSGQATVATSRFESWKSEVLDHQIVGSSKILSDIVTLRTGKAYSVKRFRLPFGSGVKNAAIGARLQQSNVSHYFWAVDSLDWQDRNPASIVQRVREQMTATGKGIILFHDIHKQSYEATQLLIQQTQSNAGIRYVTLTEAGL